MDDISIFAIGVFVTLLFLIGVVHTVKEFKKMSRGKEQDVPRDNKIEVDQ